MSLNDAFIAELQQEAVATRKCLERIPDNKFDWKPHEKSFTMSRLATHIADERLRQFLLQNLEREGDGFRWRVNLGAIAANMDSLVGFPAFDACVTYPGPTCFLAGGLRAMSGPSTGMRSSRASRTRSS